MRDIRFRAWNHQFKQMALWEMIKLECNRFSFLESKDWDFMQFTGLKDKNGKEIYEGDIILRKGLEIAYEIKWINESGGFFLVHKDMRMPLSAMYLSIMDIIGNIYSNPELLINPRSGE